MHRWELDLRRKPEGSVRLWRMWKRGRKKLRRQLATVEWLMRITPGGPGLRHASILELERFLLTCAGLVLLAGFIRACAW